MVIGITGGVGCGKSTILHIMEQQYGFTALEADKIGHMLMKKGTDAYHRIVAHFGSRILNDLGEIDRKILGEIVFADETELSYLNHIIHPGVQAYIEEQIRRYPDKNYLIEAALLLEAGYQKICDQIWYVYAEDAPRRARLKESRGYSDEKIESIWKNQMSREEFEKRTDYTIDNSGTIEAARQQLEKIVEFSGIL